MKVFKRILKLVAMFGIGLAIGKMIHKRICKKYAYNVIELSNCKDMILQ